MHENDKPVLVYTTFPETTLAESAGADLVRQELCACVNIIPGMTSVYRWQGKIETAAETVMIIKTRAGLVDEVCAAVLALHPYEVPALVCVPVTGGLPAYLDWIAANTRSPAK